MISAIADLFGALAGVPSLPGAKCRGRPHLFDGPAHGEPAPVAEARHQQALGLCRLCPSLDRCGDYLESLPPRERPLGVIAARIITDPKADRP